MGDEDRAGSEQQRRAPAIEQRHVGRERKHRAGMPGMVCMRTIGTRSTSSIVTAGSSVRAVAQHVVGRSDDAEHHFRGRGRRDHVRRDPALDEPERVERLAELRVGRPRQRAHPHERVEQLVDRRLAVLRDATSAPRVRKALRRRRSTPRVAMPSRLSVGSPLIRKADERAAPRSPPVAPSLPRSSPTTKSRPTRRSPSARSRSAAATCAARMPFASQEPRP